MFDLKAVVDAVLASTDGVRKTSDLAQQVAEAIPTNALRIALEEALPAYIRSRISLTRNLTHAPVDPYVDTKPRQAGQRNAARSSAVRAIRQWWLDTVEVHVADGGYLKLGECTLADLMFAVEDRRRRAQDMSRAADRYEKIARAMKDADVPTVADLPKKVLAELTSLFERAA